MYDTYIEYTIYWKRSDAQIGKAAYTNGKRVAILLTRSPVVYLPVVARHIYQPVIIIKLFGSESIQIFISKATVSKERMPGRDTIFVYQTILPQ